MPAREVIVTGVGLVTPLGSTAAETAQAWRSGASAEFLPEALLAGTPLKDMRVARRPVFDAAERLGGRRMLKFMSEAAMLGCVAAREACQQARLRERFKPERIGLFAGTGLAAASVDEARPMLEASIGADGHFSCAALGRKGLAAANPLLSFKILANMPPCLISIIEGIKGPNLIFSPWEAQSAEALIEAWRAVADGDVDAALAGAADHPAHPATVVYLRQSGRLKADEHPAPAGAYVVLESAERAARDGLTPLAIVESIDVCEEQGASSGESGIGPAIHEHLGRSFAAEPAVSLALTVLALPAASGLQPVAGTAGNPGASLPREGAVGDALAPTWERADVSEANAGRGGSDAVSQGPVPSPRTRIRSSRPSPMPGGEHPTTSVVLLPLHNGRSLRIRLRAPA
jgi:hypothetical protein